MHDKPDGRGGRHDAKRQRAAGNVDSDNAAAGQRTPQHKFEGAPRDRSFAQQDQMPGRVAESVERSRDAVENPGAAWFPNLDWHPGRKRR